jgi:2-oxo-4-hydroxy-4-carboxy-5-ureidoimidazoline decarboxylase
VNIANINAMTGPAFIAKFGVLFEHSPWIVAAAEIKRPFSSVVAMETTMTEVVRGAGEEAQLALIRAHPELAGKAAIDKTLTVESSQEQASAGLDRLTAKEYARFHALNSAYETRFAFPFIICVRMTDKAGILTAMEDRLANDRTAEIATACREIGKIVHLRLADMLEVEAA